MPRAEEDQHWTSLKILEAKYFAVAATRMVRAVGSAYRQNLQIFQIETSAQIEKQMKNEIAGKLK